MNRLNYYKFQQSPKFNPKDTIFYKSCNGKIFNDYWKTKIYIRVKKFEKNPKFLTELLRKKTLINDSRFIVYLLSTGLCNVENAIQDAILGDHRELINNFMLFMER